MSRKNISRCIVWAAALLLAFCLPAAFVGAQDAVPTPESQTVSGVLTVVVGDPMPTDDQPLTPPPAQFTLTTADGRAIRLLPGAVGEEALFRLSGQMVTVTVSPGGAAGGTPAIQAVERAAAGGTPAIQGPAVAGNTKWLTIACQFPDVADQLKPIGFFRDMYASTYPGLDHYFREASYNTVNLVGSTAVGWHKLPQPLTYYVSDTVYLDRLFNDCAALADPSVNFADYTGINLVFNARIGCCSWGGLQTATLDGVSRNWATTWMASWAFPYLSVFQHEMLHAYGIRWHPYSYDFAYLNGWDVVSSTYTHCGLNEPHPVYGCIGQHTSAYHRHHLGWLPDSKVVTVGPGRTTVTLEQATLPTNGGPLMAVVPIDGSSTHYYVIEARRQVGYDAQLAGNSIVIHEIGGSRHKVQLMGSMAGSQVGPTWEAGHTWATPRGNLSVTVDETLPTGYRITVVTGLTRRSMTLNATADTYIDQDRPTTNFGRSATLLVREETPHWATLHAKNAYLGFNVAQVPAGVVSARLRLTAVGPLPPTYPTVMVEMLDQGDELPVALPINESTLTYGSWDFSQKFRMPRMFSPSAAGATWLEYEVAEIINHWGPTALNRLIMAYSTGHSKPDLSYDTFTFSSREGANPPQLVIDYLVPPDEPKTTTFAPTNDAYVLASQKNKVFNTPRLQVRDAAADMNAYIKFNLTGLTGAVQSATLRLWVLDPGPDGGKVYATSPYYKASTTLWYETGLTWNNAPAIAGAPLDAAGAVAKGKWIELDVTPAITGNGRASFALSNDSANVVAYGSKEGARAPQLVVVTK